MPNKLSLYTLILCLGVMFYSGFMFYPRWKQTGTNAAIAWDVSGYYWYLPSIFIYKDLRKQEFKDSILKKYKPTLTDFQQGILYKGNYVMKYSSGMALMYLPFFAIGHLAASACGYPQDGFSIPYQLSIQVGGFLVALLGLWYFRKLLLKFYTDKVAAVCLLILVLGTNYLNYAGIDNAMPHSWLFTLYVLLILATIKFYEKPGYKYAICIGLLIGLATLTRPTDIISCLLPLLWGLEGLTKAAIKKHIDFLFKNLRFLFVVAVCAAAVFCIQLIYWKHTTGQWLVYSYSDQKFSWRSPHIVKYIFNYTTGWLVYTPMMFLAFIGLVPLVKNNRHRVAIIVFFLINLYIVCAWDQWYYGGRAMVQSYAILMFPIAALVDVMMRKKYLKWILSPAILLFVYANVWVTYNVHAGEGILDGETMSSEYFWLVAGRWHKPAKFYERLKDTDELFEGTPHNMQPVYSNNYEDSTTYTHGAVLDGTRSLFVGPSSDHPSSGWDKFAYAPGRSKWIRLQAHFLPQDKEDNVWQMRQFIVRFLNKDEVVKERMIRVDRFLEHKQSSVVYFDAKVPTTAFDSVGISFWNPGSDNVLIVDQLQVWSFN